MNTDSIWRPSLESDQEFFRPVGGSVPGADVRGGERELVGQRVSQPARQVGHGGGVGHTAAVNPPEDLAGPEPLVAACFERGLEFEAVEPGEIGTRLFGRHHLPPLPCYNVQSIV